jgi:hypothetical protein
MTVREVHPPEAAEIRKGGHFVQFYQDDAYLVESVGAYIAASLGVREGAIVIATPEHREALAQSLRNRGIEVAGAIARRQFLCLDARETLDLFMVDGMPDADLFRGSVGKLVDESLASWKHMRAFGEMVALLWAEGNREGALRLEQLWNRLGESRAFTLFCAYQKDAFGAEMGPYKEVCHEHTHVLTERR